jgi:hypothetical protein
MRLPVLLLCLIGGFVSAHPSPAFFAPTTTIRATGKGLPPPQMSGQQARLMAERAAQVIAVRNLAATVRGLPIPDHGNAASPLPAEVAARIRGYRYLPARPMPDGSVEVTVELDVHRDFPRVMTLLQRTHQAEADLAATKAALQRIDTKQRSELEELRRRVNQLAGEISQLRTEIRELQASIRRDASSP